MSAAARVERGALLAQQGRYELAENELRAALAEDPRHARAHALLALCLAEREQRAEAEREAREAVGLAPDEPFSHYALGKVLQERRSLDAAAACFQTAIELDPEDPDYRAALAHVRAAAERWTESLAAADAGLALDPEHHDCVNMRAQALRHLDRVAEAEATVEDALRRTPSSALAHANQGWTLLHRGDHRGASEHFREALWLDADSEWARVGMLEALKARVPLYRPLLAYFLWLQRKPFQVRVAIAVGSYIAIRSLGATLEHHPESRTWVLPLYLALIVFAWSSWMARPVSNLCLLLHPLGRHALAALDRLEAAAVGIFLAAGIGVGTWEICTLGAWSNALIIMIAAIPVLCVRVCPEGWPRRTMMAIAATLALWGVAETSVLQWRNHAGLTRAEAKRVDPYIDATLDPYIYSVLLSQFLVIPLSRATPRR